MAVIKVENRIDIAKNAYQFSMLAEQVKKVTYATGRAMNDLGQMNQSPDVSAMLKEFAEDQKRLLELAEECKAWSDTLQAIYSCYNNTQIRSYEIAMLVQKQIAN